MSNLIALFPGSFKPPHKGHFDVIEKISNIEGISKVQILISAPTKSLRSSLSASDARRVFEIYSRDGLFGCLVEFIESPMPSPIAAVYN